MEKWQRRPHGASFRRIHTQWMRTSWARHRACRSSPPRLPCPRPTLAFVPCIGRCSCCCGFRCFFRSAAPLPPAARPQQRILPISASPNARRTGPVPSTGSRSPAQRCSRILCNYAVALATCARARPGLDSSAGTTHDSPPAPHAASATASGPASTPDPDAGWRGAGAAAPARTSAHTAVLALVSIALAGRRRRWRPRART